MAVKIVGSFEDELLFSSGKKLYANRAIIGINPDLEIYGGYDDGISISECSLQDLVELADHQIRLWKRFKAKHIRRGVQNVIAGKP